MNLSHSKNQGLQNLLFWGFSYFFGHCPTFWVLSYLSYFFGIIPTFVLLFGFFSLLFLKFLVFRPSLMLRYLWGTRITIATFSGVYHCPMGRLCSLCYNRGQKGKAKLSESAVKIQKIFCLSKCFYGN